MTKAYDCFAMNDHVAILSLKRILRIIGDDVVIIKFSDGSQLIYTRADSWRFDKLEIKQ